MSAPAISLDEPTQSFFHYYLASIADRLDSSVIALRELVDQSDSIRSSLNTSVRFSSEILEAIKGLSFAPKTGSIEIVGELDGVPAELVGGYTTQ